MTFRELGERIEQYFLEVLNERRRRPIDKVVTGILFLISRVYLHIVQLRLWLYKKRVIRNRPLGCQVITIGNLTCGGTGKTPVVEKFARELSKQGRKVAILSRGYRSKDKRSFWEKLRQMNKSENREVEPRVVSDGKSLRLGYVMAGDEPFMLANNVPEACVIVDKNRVKSGKWAIKHYDVDTLILDDGFQYLDLYSNINILLVDATCPFDNHHVLPRGLMREPIENVRRADYIFLTKSDGSERLKHLKKFLHKHNSRAEIIECCHSPKYLQAVYGYENKVKYPLDSINGRKVASLSAIANPASFNRFLKQNGAIIVLEKHYADHHFYTQQEMLDFFNQAKAAGAEFVMTTEKDAVRIPRIDNFDRFKLRLLFLRIEIEILHGNENFKQCIRRICFKYEHKTLS